MAHDTVKAIRDVEEKAMKIEQDANQEKEEILMKALEDSKNLVSTETKIALAQSEKALAQVQVQATQILEEAKKEAEEEILLLKKEVASKLSDAQQVVIAHITM